MAKQLVLIEEYFISSLISGLKDKIKYTVQMLRAENEDQALSLARLREASLDVIAQRARGVRKPYSSAKPSYAPTPTFRPTSISSPQVTIVPSPSLIPSKLATTTTSPTIPIKRLTLAEMKARRE